MYNRAQSRRSATSMMRFPAPKKGWIRNENLQKAAKDGAEVLENIFPTLEGARLRKGSTKHATVTDAAVAIMPFNAASGVMFAATATDIYDITAPADVDTAETPIMSSLSSGDWSYTQFSTTAGDYLVAVNGQDYAIHYGSSMEPIGPTAVYELAYDALTGDFATGLTLTGGTSGATATIYAVEKLTATTGVLKIGTVTGTFQDNETITDSATGSATENGTVSAGSTITISGVDTRNLSQVWQSHDRLFFIEKDTLSAWYLSTKSIGGTATELPLGSLFRHGGSLLFGGTWSLDSGAGQDDVCIFVTDQGEIAVYSGTNPASAATWALVGVYKMGKPLNKHAAFQAGGDLAIMTEDGIVPVSAATRKDRAALQSDAITFPIEDAWREVVFGRDTSFPFSATLWQSSTMLVIGIPPSGSEDGAAFVANARSGAWCKFTGWDIRCSAVFGDRFYFGTSDGLVARGESGGTDIASGYTGRWVPKFSDGGQASCKMAIHARLQARSTTAFTPSVQAFSDYYVGAWDTVSPLAIDASSTWGTGVWGAFKWGGEGEKVARTEWQAVSAIGTALSPAFQIASDSTIPPTLELISADMIVEQGAPL